MAKKTNTDKIFLVYILVLSCLILGVLIAGGIQIKQLSKTLNSLKLHVDSTLETFENTLAKVDGIVDLVQETGEEMFYHQFANFREFKIAKTDELQFLTKRGGKILDSTFDDKLIKSIEISLQEFKDWRKK